MQKKRALFSGHGNDSLLTTTDFRPARIVEIEIGQPVPALTAMDELTGRRYQRAILLVRLHGHPLGTVEMELGEDGLIAATCAQQIWSSLNKEINDHLRRDGLMEITGLDEAGISGKGTPLCIEERCQAATSPFVSVIVATRDRPESLEPCLDLLLRLDYPDYEVVLVDNAPSTDATANFVRQRYDNESRLRYVREERPGLSWARNRGLLEARGEIIAYTDDDVRVDPGWLTGLVNGFSVAEKVVCVTGLTLPAELETPAQAWFEEYSGFGKGFVRQIYDRDKHLPANRMHRLMYPYAVSALGGGHNMAFKAAFLTEIGGFDPALGAGTPTHGGEDFLAFYQVIKRGYRLVYEPNAIAFHVHRREYDSLKKQIHGYGVGLTALMTKYICDDPGNVIDIILRLPSALLYLTARITSKNNKEVANYPREMAWLELLGAMYGPVAYGLSRLKNRQIVKQFGSLDNNVHKILVRS